ncbi:MAG: hypothetical protein JWL84_115 [Rhodospirillales bacterium]|jgi:hypothetical protein|nr:hypothetical protein [Rhodospirillales bacterium]
MRFRIMLQSLINGALIDAGTEMEVPPAGTDASGKVVLHVPGPHWIALDHEAREAVKAANLAAPAEPGQHDSQAAKVGAIPTNDGVAEDGRTLSGRPEPTVFGGQPIDRPAEIDDADRHDGAEGAQASQEGVL